MSSLDNITQIEFTPSKDCHIEVRNLSFGYRKNLENIVDMSFSIKKGSWVSIVGHNGSGKSTLAKLLMGLEAARSGQIYVDGILLNEDTLDEVLKKLGIVFQNPDNQFVGATVKHDIAFGMENRQVNRAEMIEKINHYANLVGMGDFLGKEPHLLSGGQKQRVAIAGALAANQDILIFDEATSMLDPEGVLDISHMILDLNKNHNKTILTITHDLDFAMKSDYVIVLKEGKIICEGIPEDVFVQKEMLESSNLKIPLALELYQKLQSDHQISQNKEMLKKLWEFILKV